MRLMLSMVTGVLLCSLAWAEDWTTSDGKTYQHVKVVKIEDDAVTILDRDGGARVLLATLPPNLQAQFHYDPEKAKIAAAKHDADEQASARALLQEKKMEQAPVLASSEPVKSSAIAALTPVVAVASPVTVAANPTSPAIPSSPSPAPSSQFSLNPGSGGLSTTSGEHQNVNPNWKLVWSDEFDGTAVDTSKWTFEIDGKGGGNGEMEYYTDKPENAHVENGHLLITAIKDGTDAEGRKHKFTSARMVTKGKSSWKYGRFEARIKLPTGRGIWPAFWLMPADSVYGGWASSGEIDIVEEVGHEPATAYGTLHYGDKWPHNTHTGDKFTLPSGNLSDDFHVYAVEWEEGVIRWYIDGKLYQTQTKWYTKAAPFPAPFDQNFFIIMNFAVGGAWPGKPAPDTAFPQSMEVDYVRVYQPDPASAK